MNRRDFLASLLHAAGAAAVAPGLFDLLLNRLAPPSPRIVVPDRPLLRPRERWIVTEVTMHHGLGFYYRWVPAPGGELVVKNRSQFNILAPEKQKLLVNGQLEALLIAPILPGPAEVQILGHEDGRPETAVARRFARRADGDWRLESEVSFYLPGDRIENEVLNPTLKKGDVLQVEYVGNFDCMSETGYEPGDGIEVE